MAAHWSEVGFTNAEASGMGEAWSMIVDRRGQVWGIAGMRARASRAGGTLDVTSQPGAGTTIKVTLPLD